MLFMFVTLVIGFLFLAKKVADMQRYHALRVVILTSMLICLIIYLLVNAFPVREPRCTPDYYCQTEM